MSAQIVPIRPFMPVLPIAARSLDEIGMLRRFCPRDEIARRYPHPPMEERPEPREWR